MNYLVHLFVSRHNEPHQIGNWLGDMIRNSELPQLPDAVREGVRLHRAIDSFSDNHPVIRAGVDRIRKHQGKYAPVVLDIFYDHILYRNWGEFTGAEYERFTAQFYGRLTDAMAHIPDRVKPRAKSMIKYDFLSAYQDEEGMNDVFRRVAERASFDNSMRSAYTLLEKDWEEFNRDFREFFPELMAFVKSNSSAGSNQT